MEERVVERVPATARVARGRVAADTMNLFTRRVHDRYPDCAGARGQSRRRDDSRQLGLARAVVDDGRLPPGHVLYEGARRDGPTVPVVPPPSGRACIGFSLGRHG